MRISLITAMIVGAFLAGMAMSRPFVGAEAANSETYRQLNLFGDVFERVREDYVEEVEDPEIIEAAINGMLQSLDPHSSYMNPKNYRDMQIQTRGEFGGLGIEVTMEEGFVKVVSPIDDTPAMRAGLKSGDYITHLDGETVLGLTLSEAVEKMRGPVSTSLTVTIAREGKKPFDVILVRDKIKIRSVRYHVEGDDVGYIRVTSFNEQTLPGIEKAIKEFDNDLGDKLKGYVLDLRNNPGGLLDQAIGVSDAFLERGEIVSTRGRHARDIQRFNANRGDMIDGKPIIVLINGGSASASEIVAGALQDHRRALVMGMRSFGKGSVQTIIPLGSQGAIRLTTARYYTPSGRTIQAKGIWPDIEVASQPLDPEAKKVLIEKQRGEAALRNHLSVDGEGEEPRQSDGVVYPISIGDEQDFQLDYALSMLRGLEPGSALDFEMIAKAPESADEDPAAGEAADKAADEASDADPADSSETE